MCFFLALCTILNMPFKFCFSAEEIPIVRLLQRKSSETSSTSSREKFSFKYEMDRDRRIS